MTISNSLFAYDKVETVNDKRIITDNYYILLYEYKCSNFNECKKCEQFRWIFSFYFKPFVIFRQPKSIQKKVISNLSSFCLEITPSHCLSETTQIYSCLPYNLSVSSYTSDNNWKVVIVIVSESHFSDLL